MSEPEVFDETPRAQVIASSSRADDVEPYIAAIYNANPKLWGDIFPWEFPQYASREVEEAFLRKFFDEREIEMQGGAQPPGNGFRFLKQVWYNISFFNEGHRVPGVGKKWLEDNKELLKAPTIFEAACSDTATTNTFFETDDFKQYGEKLLRQVVKYIQTELRKSPSTFTQQEPIPTTQELQSAQEQEELSPIDVPEATSTASAETVMESSKFQSMSPAIETAHPLETCESEEKKKEQGAAPKGKQSIPNPTSPFPAFVQPAPEPFNVTGGTVAGPENEFQHMGQREYVPPPHGTSGRGQGKGCSKTAHPRVVDHNQQIQSFIDGRNSQSQGHPGFAHMESNFYSQPPHHFTQRQSRAASRASGDFGPPPPHMMPQSHMPPPGEFNRGTQPQQYGGPYALFQQNQAPPLGFAHQNHATHPYWTNMDPLEDRTNQRKGHRVFSDEPPVSFDATFNRHGDYRDSQTYRGKRGSGNMGQTRGGRRGSSNSGGREVFFNDSQFFSSPAQTFTGAPQPPGLVYVQNDRHTSGSARTNWRTGSEHRQSQSNESFGWPQAFAPFQPRVPKHGQQYQAAGKMPATVPQPNMAIPRNLYDPSDDDNTKFTSKQGPTPRYHFQQPRNAPPLQHFPSRTQPFAESELHQYMISPECAHVTSVAVLDVPKEMPEEEVKNFFDQFGTVKCANVPANSSSLVFVNFYDHFAVIKALKGRGMSWPGGTLNVEVPKQFWDKRHTGYPALSSAWRNDWHTRESQPAIEGERPVLHRKNSERYIAADGITRDLVSDTGTPAASGSTTPVKQGGKKKSKSGKNKKAKDWSESVDAPSIDQGLKDSQQNTAEYPTAHGKENKSAQHKEESSGRADQVPQSTSEVDAHTKTEQLISPNDHPKIKLPDISADLPQHDSKNLGIKEKGTSQAAVTAPVTDKNDGSTSTHHAQQLAGPTCLPDANDGSRDSATLSPRADACQVQVSASPDEPQSQPKLEDEHVDDSFHTAKTGSPVESSVKSPESGTNDKIVYTPSNTDDGDKTPKSTRFLKINTKPESSAWNKEKSGTDVPSHTAHKKASNRAPVPLNLSKMSEQSPTSSKSGAKIMGAHSRTVSQSTMRSASAASTVMPSPFVTAPNTPDETRAPAISKKEPKQKGPAVTESLSLFGKKVKSTQKKKEKPKKAAGGSMRGEANLEKLAAVEQSDNRTVSVGVPAMADAENTSSASIEVNSAKSRKRDSIVEEKDASERSAEPKNTPAGSSEPSRSPTKGVASFSQYLHGFNFFGSSQPSSPFSPELKDEGAMPKTAFSQKKEPSESKEKKKPAVTPSEEGEPSAKSDILPTAEYVLHQPLKKTETDPPVGNPLGNTAGETGCKDNEIGLGITTSDPTAEPEPAKAKGKKRKKKSSKKAAKEPGAGEEPRVTTTTSLQALANVASLQAPFSANPGDGQVVGPPLNPSLPISKTAAAFIASNKTQNNLIKPQPSRTKKKRYATYSKQADTPPGSDDTVSAGEGDTVTPDSENGLFPFSHPDPDEDTDEEPRLYLISRTDGPKESSESHEAMGQKDEKPEVDWRVEQANVEQQCQSVLDMAKQEAIAKLGHLASMADEPGQKSVQSAEAEANFNALGSSSENEGETG